jgi:drug/metabolite transporter (DMT)-like permease
MVLNKKLHGLGSYETTAAQLLVSAVVLLIYVLFTGTMDFTALNLNTGLILLLVGIVHTGVAYWLYFGSVGKLPAQTVALFSYLDPVVALLCSWVILQQPFDSLMAVGAALSLGSTLYNQSTSEN